MKKSKVVVTKQNGFLYLRYTLEISDVIDERAVDKCKATQMPNILQLQYSDMDGKRNIFSSLKEMPTLKTFAKTPLNKIKVLKILYGLLTAFEIGPKGIPVSYIVKDSETIFVDPSNLYVFCMLVPVKQEAIDMSEIPAFFREVISEMRFEEEAGDNYLAKLFNVINSDDFEVVKLKNVVEKMLGEINVQAKTMMNAQMQQNQNIGMDSGMNNQNNETRVNKLDVMRNRAQMTQQGMNSGMPPQGMVPQGMKPGMAPQGMGMEMPNGQNRPMNPNMPPQGMGMGMPNGQNRPMNPNMPPQGMKPGMPPQGMAPQGIGMGMPNGQNRPMNPNMPPQGMKPDMVPQGMAPQGMKPGMPPQGMKPGMPPQGMAPQGMKPGMPPQGMPPQGMVPQGMAPQGMKPGMPPQGMAPQGMGMGMPNGQNRPMNSDMPEAPKPVMPEAPKPMMPEAPKPVMPEAPKPMMPEAPKPVMPEAPKPVMPEAPKPMMPEAPKPVMPEAPKPVMPEEPKPMMPEAPKPMMPEAPKPVMPEAPKPVMPEAPKPMMPEAPKPMMPEAPKPVMPEEPKPMMPEAPKPMMQKTEDKDKTSAPLIGDIPESNMNQQMGVPMNSFIRNDMAKLMEKPVPHFVRKKTGEEIYFTKPEFKIGKSKNNADYSVSDNTAISRVHCVIIQKSGVNYIKDNDSTNGTYVDGRKVMPGEEVLLKNKAQVRMGDEEFVFLLRKGE